MRKKTEFSKFSEGIVGEYISSTDYSHESRQKKLAARGRKEIGFED